MHVCSSQARRSARLLSCVGGVVALEWGEEPSGKLIPKSLLFLSELAEKSSSLCGNP